MDDFRKLTRPDDVDSILAENVAVVYKHSPTCNLSAVAQREVRRFMVNHPSVPVYIVDVIEHRDASNHVAQITGIRHHSPQTILFRRGHAMWDADHFDVTSEALTLALES